MLDVSIFTLRRWEIKSKLVPKCTASGHRCYCLSPVKPLPMRALSSQYQKGDLERQKQVLELYCARQGWIFEAVADLGSGMNYPKKGLKYLLNNIISMRTCVSRTFTWGNGMDLPSLSSDT